MSLVKSLKFAQNKSFIGNDRTEYYCKGFEIQAVSACLFSVGEGFEPSVW